jgi:hypothetical protein
MKKYLKAAIITLVFISCDCMQEANGVVLDRQTKESIGNVSLGKFENEDPNNLFSRRVFTDKKGHFDYHGISGGLSGCPDLVLFFNKKGYKTTKMVFKPYTKIDTVFLDKINLQVSFSY